LKIPVHYLKNRVRASEQTGKPLARNCFFFFSGLTKRDATIISKRARGKGDKDLLQEKVEGLLEKEFFKKGQPECRPGPGILAA